MPKRIQMRRTKGWRKPAGAIYVGRPTKWGNPFRVGHPGGAYTAKVMDGRHAWLLYKSIAGDNEKLVAAARAELRGHDLACWCPLDQPCHADVLLELANAEPVQARPASRAQE